MMDTLQNFKLLWHASSTSRKFLTPARQRGARGCRRLWKSQRHMNTIRTPLKTYKDVVAAAMYLLEHFDAALDAAAADAERCAREQIPRAYQRSRRRRQGRRLPQAPHEARRPHEAGDGTDSERRALDVADPPRPADRPVLAVLRRAPARQSQALARRDARSRRRRLLADASGLAREWQDHRLLSKAFIFRSHPALPSSYTLSIASSWLPRVKQLRRAVLVHDNREMVETVHHRAALLGNRRRVQRKPPGCSSCFTASTRTEIAVVLLPSIVSSSSPRENAVPILYRS